MRDGYVRAVTVVRVIDGDTFVCDVDLGFYVRARMSCRLAGINTPEARDPGGRDAAALLGVLLADAPVTVRSVKADKYAGRFDADVTNGRGVDVAGALVGAGMAVRWDGTGPRPAVPWPPTPKETTT